MPHGLTLTSITAGRSHTCGLDADGRAHCWGRIIYGQTSRPSGLILHTISAGEAHTCGIDTEGTPHCWGDDNRGQSSPPAGLRLVAGDG